MVISGVLLLLLVLIRVLGDWVVCEPLSLHVKSMSLEMEELEVHALHHWPKCNRSVARSPDTLYQ